MLWGYWYVKIITLHMYFPSSSNEYFHSCHASLFFIATNPCSVCNGTVEDESIVLSQAGGLTCGTLLSDAIVVEEDSNECTQMKSAELTCCPSPAENPCSVCNGTEVDESVVISADGGLTCATLVADALNVEEGSDSCAQMKVAEGTCCPQAPTMSPIANTTSPTLSPIVNTTAPTVVNTTAPTVVSTTAPSIAPVAGITTAPSTGAPTTMATSPPTPGPTTSLLEVTFTTIPTTSPMAQVVDTPAAPGTTPDFEEVEDPSSSARLVTSSFGGLVLTYIVSSVFCVV